MEDEKKERARRLNVERVKRFHEKHQLKKFFVDIPKDRLEKIDKRLEVDGLTRKDFLLQAFDFYKRNGGFPSDKS